jgi:hypothetical protein
MRRPASFFAPVLALSLLILLTTTAAQTAPSAPSPLQVVYVLDHNDVVTYDVDPDTGIPTRQGTLVVPPFFPTITPSVDGHFSMSPELKRVFMNSGSMRLTAPAHPRTLQFRP